MAVLLYILSARDRCLYITAYARTLHLEKNGRFNTDVFFFVFQSGNAKPSDDPEV